MLNFNRVQFVIILLATKYSCPRDCGVRHTSLFMNASFVLQFCDVGPRRDSPPRSLRWERLLECKSHHLFKFFFNKVDVANVSVITSRFFLFLLMPHLLTNLGFDVDTPQHGLCQTPAAHRGRFQGKIPELNRFK